MKKLFLIALLACAGCMEKKYICEIEYIDGTNERIECFYAKVKESLVGSPTVIVIYGEGGREIKSLATIKRWKLIAKGGVK